jgi:glycosyltransferase involved in cell wall biosynthesis
LREELSIGHRLWRRLPAPARRAALGTAAGLLAPRADASPPKTSNGVIIGGEFQAATGLGEASRLLQAACGRLGVARGLLPLGVGGRVATAGLPRDAALLLTVNAPSLPLMLARAPRAALSRRLVIGAWAWELPVLPPSWRVGSRYVHQVWACSDFTAAALEPLLPGRVRVVPYPLAMLDRPALPVLRADFGLPEAALIVTSVLSLGSSFTRKNPLAAIAAFKAAFGTQADRILVIKISGAAAFPKESAELRQAIGAADNIKLFDGGWSPARVEGLLGLSDIVVSLHRAEGFGLVPAQAMLRGVPVIATGWSGNLQYMDAASAALVDHRLVPVDDPSAVYGAIPGALWAEPSVEHAATLLRALADDPAARAALATRGQIAARNALDGHQLTAALAAAGIEV